MRCSFFETRLAAYVDGTLAPHARAGLARHLATCPHCTDLLAELRCVDGLLGAPRSSEPPRDFTTDVMGRVRAMPAHPEPVRARHRYLRVLAAYVAFGWVTIAAFFAFGGGSARAALGAFGSAATLSAAARHLFGRQTSDVTAGASVVLGLDALLAAALVALYAYLRAARRRADFSRGDE